MARGGSVDDIHFTQTKNKMNNAAIIGMLNDVSTSMNHHGGGYHLITVSIINDQRAREGYSMLDVNPDPSTWNTYDHLYVLEGVNYVENVFNFIGGPTKKHEEKLIAMHNYINSGNHLVLYVNKNLDLNLFNKRFGIPIEFNTENNYVIDVAGVYGSWTKKLVTGDSHSLSAWKHGFGLKREDGKTLYRFLEDAKHLSYAKTWNDSYVETITYFGNIDLRFHLMRQDNPIEATKELFNRYVEFSRSLKNNTMICLLPVENESRKLPGTGLYKGEKYFGTRMERILLRDIAHDIIKNSGQKYLMWPEEWIDQDGSAMFEYMEPRQSVHLKPKYYMNALGFQSKLSLR